MGCLVSNRIADSFQDEPPQHRSIPPSLFLRKMHLPRTGTLPERIFDGYREEEKVHDRTRGPILHSADGRRY